MTTVFFDIDTQIDFMFPAGALYVPRAERILPVISKLNRSAPLVISTMCAHTEDDPEFALYGHHCVTGTVGQHKPAATLVENPSRQVFFPKPQLDVFAVPEFGPMLERLNADRYVVYGVVTEICVQYAAFGLLASRKRVEIVTDAICALDDRAASKMLSDFESAGGIRTTSAQLAT